MAGSREHPSRLMDARGLMRLAIYGVFLTTAAVGALAGGLTVIVTISSMIERQLGLEFAAQSRSADNLPKIMRAVGEWSGGLVLGDDRGSETPSGPSGHVAINPKVGANTDDGKRFYSGDGDTYRTVCVRLCDGYFWTVSFSTTEDHFERDQGRCEASCGVPAKLFKYKNPGERPEDMEDMEGRRYAKLKTAFLFRTRFLSSCRCTAEPWSREAQARQRLHVLADAKVGRGDRSVHQERARLNLEVESSSAERLRTGLATLQKLQIAAPTRKRQRANREDSSSESAQSEATERTKVASSIQRLTPTMRLGGEPHPTSRPARGATNNRPAAEWQRKAFTGN